MIKEMNVNARPVVRTLDELGECPKWHPQEQSLYWVDILAGILHRFVPETGELQHFTFGQPLGALGLRKGGGLILATGRNLAVWDGRDGELEIITELGETTEPAIRFNDGSVDAKGRFWTGTIDNDMRGNLYRLAPDGTLSKVLSDIHGANGIGWSCDHRTMYFTETRRRRILAFDFDEEAGELRSQRVFSSTETEPGWPDGLVVDLEDHVWSAGYGGYRISRYDCTGRLERTLRLPVSQPTSLTFGGPDRDELYITTAYRSMTAADRASQPLAGALFSLDPGCQGQIDQGYWV